MGKLPLDRAEVDRLTALLVDGLTGLGYTHTCKDGHLQRVTVKRRLLTESGSLLLVELDTERLPRGVNAADLVHAKTLHHLGAVVHHPVKALNHVGVTLAIVLDPLAGKVTLPAAADLAAVLRTWDGQPYTFPLGAGPSGPVWERLRGHYLLGGETGSGKTTFLLATCLALSQTTPPAALRLVVIDPKVVDLAPLAGLPHGQGRPVASTPNEAAALLDELVGEIERRQRAFLRTLARDLDGYNAKNPPGGPLPRILAVIDEVCDLLTLAGGQKSALYRALQRLVTLGRAFGLHVLLATQNPRYDVLGTLIKGNLAGRLAFRVTTPEHSRVILGETGAERLPRHPGRFLAKLGDGRLQPLQGFTVSAAALDELALPAASRASAPGAAAGAGWPDLPLTDTELAMLRYSRDALAWHFGQPDVMAEGFARREYRRLVKKLEGLGLVRHDKAEGNALYLDHERLEPALDRLDHPDGVTV